jgi:hypothetical protein
MNESVTIGTEAPKIGKLRFMPFTHFGNLRRRMMNLDA